VNVLAATRSCASSYRLERQILTQRLADQVDSGLIVRNIAPDGGKTEVYVLTNRAHSLHNLLRCLYVWGKSHAAEFGATIEDPLKELAQ
jgi:DNA-binding HxlR family transcriptional regulator